MLLSPTKGDPAARALLQKAIRARYGPRPLGVDNLRVTLGAQTTGPLGLPLKQQVTQTFVSTGRWRRDETYKMLGILRRSYTLTFDNGTCYERESKTPTPINEQEAVKGMYSRVWLELAFYLTPLNEPNVTLKSVDEKTFQAFNEDRPEQIVKLRLDEHDNVSVEGQSYHPPSRRTLKVTLSGQSELVTFEGMTIPKQITYRWEGGTEETFDVLNAEVNPNVSPTEFTVLSLSS